jgi:hypothetical protein
MRKVLAMLLLASCADDGMKLDDFLAARRGAECSRLARCGLFASETTCNAYFRTPHDESLRAAIAKNKVAYDGTAAQKCLDALAAISCDTTQRDARLEPEPCAQVFTGRIEDGAACGFDGECKSEVCTRPACARDECCLGTCAPTISSPIDGPCEVDAQCAGDAYCHKSKVCRARSKANASCDDARGCDFGLACVDLTEFAPGTCRKLPLVGESCPYNVCGEVNARCENFTCTAFGLPGAACVDNSDCSPFTPCDLSTGMCADLPALGQACTLSCAGEAWCSNGTCVEPQPDKAMCEDNDDRCQSALCVDGPVFEWCVAPVICI